MRHYVLPLAALVGLAACTATTPLGPLQEEVPAPPTQPVAAVSQAPATPAPAPTATAAPAAATPSPAPTASVSSGSSGGSSGGSASAVAPLEASVEIQEFQFAPASVTVRQGGRVTFHNVDAGPHDITPGEGAAFEASPLIQMGQSAVVTFTAAGSQPYRCTLHPTEAGTVVVR